MSLSKNNSLPELLSQVNQLPYGYADGDGIDFEPYDVFLSVDETSRWFRAWTGNSDADASKFRVFGQDGTGGYVAFWTVRNTSDLLAQPIVFMGSEVKPQSWLAIFTITFGFLLMEWGLAKRRHFPNLRACHSPN